MVKAHKSKTKAPRKYRGKGRKGKKVHGLSKVPKLTKVHTFKRTSDCNAVNFVVSTSSFNGETFSKTPDGFYISTGTLAFGTNLTYYSWALYGTLDMLPDYSEFTNLFDQYRINWMSLKMVPFQNVSLANSTGGQQCLAVVHYSVTDYDDATPYNPTTGGVQLMREKQSFKEKNFFTTKPFKRATRPRIAMAAYASGAFTSYANMKPQWIDCNSPSVQHYAFKGVFEVFAPSTSVASLVWFRPELTINISCRDVR